MLTNHCVLYADSRTEEGKEVVKLLEFAGLPNFKKGPPNGSGESTLVVLGKPTKHFVGWEAIADLLKKNGHRVKSREQQYALYKIEKFIPRACPRCAMLFGCEGKDYRVLNGKKTNGSRVERESHGHDVIQCLNPDPDKECRNVTARFMLEERDLIERAAAMEEIERGGFVNLQEVWGKEPPKEKHRQYSNGKLLQEQEIDISEHVEVALAVVTDKSLEEPAWVKDAYIMDPPVESKQAEEAPVTNGAGVTDSRTPHKQPEILTDQYALSVLERRHARLGELPCVLDELILGDGEPAVEGAVNGEALPLVVGFIPERASNS